MNTPVRNQDIGKRLLLYIGWLKMSQRAFSIAVGLSNGQVSQVINKGTSLGIDKVEKILNTFPDLNVNWLITGKGNMLLDDKKSQFIVNPEILVQEPELRYLDKEMSYINRINELDIEIQTLYKVIRILTREELSKEEIVSILKKNKS